MSCHYPSFALIQEDEVKELDAQLFSRPEFQNNRQLEELRSENDKLNYRAAILQRVSIRRSIDVPHAPLPANRRIEESKTSRQSDERK